jgi:hypothetical protein
LHRKVVTVLFCDVVDSTALGSVDPEALQGLLARYFERMKAIVESHEGSVEKFIGDAVMAVFGVPQVHEDDALRACRAAVEMRAAFPEPIGGDAHLDGAGIGRAVIEAEHEWPTSAYAGRGRIGQRRRVGEKRRGSQRSSSGLRLRLSRRAGERVRARGVDVQPLLGLRSRDSSVGRSCSSACNAKAAHACSLRLCSANASPAALGVTHVRPGA